uniref:hypothetical protein n=1 Tax=Ensifer adhaerens TaxID=106592 RepID=UPI003F492B63
MRWHLLLLAVLSGCAKLPTSDDLQAFSDAASSGSSAVRTAITSADLVAARYDEQKAAQGYILNGVTAASSIPERQTRIESEAMLAMLDALENLSSYTRAIGTAADQKNVEELEAAAENLGKAAGNLAKVSGAPAGPVVAPAFVAGGRLFGYALADQYTRQVLTIIQENDAVVSRLVDLLQADFELISGELEFQVGDYSEERERTIRLIRADSRVTRAALYDHYMAARADIAANEALQQALSNGQTLLESIKITHHKLATGDPDVQMAVTRFEKSAGDLAALITAIREERVK